MNLEKQRSHGIRTRERDFAELADYRCKSPSLKFHNKYMVLFQKLKFTEYIYVIYNYQNLFLTRTNRVDILNTWEPPSPRVATFESGS